MCGLSGVIRSKKLSLKKGEGLNGFIKDAIIMGTVRGEHSTGMVQIRDNGDIITNKLPASGFFFAADSRTRSMANNVDISQVTLLHHRAATRGNISYRNCHPFEHTVGERQVIGIHNGHISNAPSFFNSTSDIEVDSDWAFKQIAERGGPVAIGEMQGAIAFVWWQNDGKVRMYANGKRPLHYAHIKGTDATVFMSEDAMMYALCQRNGLEIEKTPYYIPDDNNIWVFDPENQRELTTEKIEKKKVAAVVPYVPPAGASTDIVSYKKTPYGTPVEYSQAVLRQIGLSLGEEVEFFPFKDEKKQSLSSVQGEVCLVGPGNEFDSVRVHRAMILNTAEALKANIMECSDMGGSTWCTVLGWSRVPVAGGVAGGSDSTELAVVLSTPIQIDYVQKDESKNTEPDDDSLINYEDTSGEHEKILPGPNGNKVSYKTFSFLVRDGCACCTGSLTPRDAYENKISWLPDNSPLCKSCADAQEEQLKTGTT